ncbi:MAG: ATP-binding protein, partial [Nodosilinea sp.]
YATMVKTFTSEDISFLQAIANTLAATIQRDQTAQALAKSRERLDLAIDAASMGIWELDVATDKATWNDAEYSLLGLRPSEVAEPNAELFYRYVHPSDVLPTQEALAAAIEQKTEFNTEFRIIRDGSPVRWLAAKARVITNAEGYAVKVIGVNYDITERKQNEEQLKDADRRKDDFLATLGHELRNPLNAISSSLTLMNTLDEGNASGTRAEADTERLPQRSQQLRSMAERQVRQLNRLVNDLLDVSRIAHQKIQLHRQRMNLTQLLHDVVEDTQDAVAEKGLSLETTLLNDPVWIKGDSVRLMQAFSNILQNAVKFSDSGGRMAISAGLEAEFVTVTIADAGIGIEREALVRIFTAFSQEDRSLARSGGLGLGLPLAKGIIELHGGQIWADSLGLGHGTTVTVRLPLAGERSTAERPVAAMSGLEPPAVPEQPTPGSSRTPTAVGQPKRVLVLEDDADSAFLLKIFLEGKGYQVDMAGDGESGVSLALQISPHAIISDISLTNAMDGYGFAQAIRSDPNLSGVYLIAASGYGQSEDKARAKAAGFDVHFTKPINLEQLATSIEQNLSSAQGDA